jgi:hypothetical protein
MLAQAFQPIQRGGVRLRLAKTVRPSHQEPEQLPSSIMTGRVLRQNHLGAHQRTVADHGGLDDVVNPSGLEPAFESINVLARGGWFDRGVRRSRRTSNGRFVYSESSSARLMYFVRLRRKPSCPDRNPSPCSKSFCVTMADSYDWLPESRTSETPC